LLALSGQCQFEAELRAMVLRNILSLLSRRLIRATS
jgi:hypothetical protein